MVVPFVLVFRDRTDKVEIQINFETPETKQIETLITTDTKILKTIVTTIVQLRKTTDTTIITIHQINHKVETTQTNRNVDIVTEKINN